MTTAVPQGDKKKRLGTTMRRFRIKLFLGCILVGSALLLMEWNRNNYTTAVAATVAKTEPPLAVSATDLVYRFGYDDAPIVVERYKLVFFTIPKVGCTVFKQLFRRMEGHADYLTKTPHVPSENGLKYLSHYSLEQATAMLTHPDWTRAVFVRNPHDRFLSAYLDKAKQNEAYLHDHCCKPSKLLNANHQYGKHPNDNSTISTNDSRQELISQECVKMARASLEGFVELVTNPNYGTHPDWGCMDPHWRPQWQRMEAKFWPKINFLGRFDSVEKDTRLLLQQLNAWQTFGKSGWGVSRNESVFGPTKTKHATGAKGLVHQYYTPQTWKRVRDFYREDYENAVYSRLFRKQP